MTILQCTQNDVVVHCNDVIRNAHCALNIESTQHVAILTFKWTLYVTKSKNSMQLYVVVIKMRGLKDSDSNIIMILLHENKPVVWSGPYIMCYNY